MNGGLQSVGFLCGFFSLMLIIIATILPFWKMNDRTMEQTSLSRDYEGLWWKCNYLMMNNGVYQCSTVYDAKFFIALPSYLQGARGFSITSIVLGSIGLICGIVGMECTRIAEENDETKRNMGKVSGICFLLSGVLFLVGVSWYAAQIYISFGDIANGFHHQWAHLGQNNLFMDTVYI